MIKLKSLFRRGGQGPSGSSKQSTNTSSNQLRGATSTSSLNSIGLSTTSSSTTATPKSSKSALKKVGHTGSNDHFESATFHESHESLDLKNASKLYAQSSGSGNIGSSSSISGGINLSFSGSGGSNHNNSGSKFTTHSPESAASISASSNKQYGFGVGSRTHDELRADQLHYIQTSMLMPAEQQLSSKSASASGCVNKLSNDYRDSDNETGVDDGGTSCFSGSMRDLLSSENLTEDCTFNGPEESQVKFNNRATHVRGASAQHSNLINLI